jgi:flagellar hook-associated protein 1 FlgK
MSSLLASMGSAASALDVLQQALGVVQNNVSNASTPGYASQQLNIEAAPFDVATGAGGGLTADGLQSSEDTFANTAVQQQLQTLGLYTAQTQSTNTIQSFFDASGTTGVSAALNNLITAFSSWSASPTDPATGQQVISSASALASSVQGLSQSLNSTAVQLNQQVGSTVDQINSLGAQIQQYNEAVQQNGNQQDPGAAAQLENNLENLSQLVNMTTLTQPDGTVTVLVGGGTPLVIGDQLNSLSASDFLSQQPPPVNPEAPPTAHVLDSNGNDITADITGGQLGGLLDSRNRVLASMIGDGQQPGSLNVFASTLANTVNGILESGTVSTQAGAAAGTALFTYNNADATLAAGSLAVTPAITPAQLAPVDSSGNSNGNANTLASLGTSNTQGVVNGENLVAYFAGIASAAGQENQTAQSNQTLQQQVVSQVTSTRDQVSGVSLDGQAAEVLQLQRSYQAVSQVLTIINDMADSILDVIPLQV